MILQETNFSQLLTESAEEGKNLYLKGVFLQGAQKNRNGRVYPTSEIESAVNKVLETIKSGGEVLGELDHPANLEIRLANVSHQIVEMHMEGDNAIGKALILPTPMGNIARNLLESKIKIGVSSRGSGHVNESTGMVEDFDMVTVDIVATPSAQQAYPTSVYEQMEYFKRRSELLNLAEAINHDNSAQKYFEREMVKFIEELFKN
jgi:hypothetical protein